MTTVLDQLQAEPALAWKVAVGVLGKRDDSPEAQSARQAVRSAPLVRTLLSDVDKDPWNLDASGDFKRFPGDRVPGREARCFPYSKWCGSHWILSSLADLGYPPGDESLRPMMDETFDCWLSETHRKHIRLVNGRTRRCASQEGNAVWSSLRLGLVDGRTAELASRLLDWQWPDGGWNCDKRPEVETSSFMETLIPLRALALYARVSGDPQVAAAAERAAEVFLKRRLFRRLADGSVMDKHFVRLHYPVYWHYDILAGLKVMAEAGFIRDPRCNDALDLLESKRLPGGGFPAEMTYSQSTRPSLSGYTPVTWGGTGKVRPNPFVTADALYVLRMAGRLVQPS
ncbi:MAG: hypothetical protein FJZ96_00430 [Chloroflexi bacterium]|nr:hypothetical protein [Chloroflexota bacterium]